MPRPSKAEDSHFLYPKSNTDKDLAVSVAETKGKRR